MKVPTSKWKSDPIDFLVDRRYPQVRWLSKQDQLSAPGVSSRPTVRNPSDLIRRVEEYRTELEGLSADHLDDLVKKALSADEQLRRQREEEKEAKYQFNSPSARADFEYWAKASSWSIDEIVALSLDRDPRFVTWSSVKSLTKVSKTAKDFEDRRLLFRRAVGAQQLYEFTFPGIAIAWMERVKIEFPQRLKQSVTELGLQTADWKTLYERVSGSLNERDAQIEALSARIEELESANADLLKKASETKAINPEIDQRERGSFLKIVFGLAYTQYGFDGGKPRSTAPAEIADDLAHAGVSLSTKTIRKFLQEGYEMFGNNASF